MPPLDVNALAAEVVLIVKTAISPVLERVAAAEARLAVLGDLRDRVVTVETKAALPVPVLPDLPVPVDLAPVLERLAGTEARLAVLGDLRDRVVTVETKAAMPQLQGQQGEPGKDGERGPEGPAGLTGPIGERGGKGLDGLLGASGERGPEGAEGKPGRDGRDGLAGIGEKGLNGTDGRHGVDGKDGLGFDDFEELYDGERTITHRYRQGDRVKEFVWKMPIELYRGVYTEGKTYERGDGTTWAGSEWHANETTTTKPGDGSKAWTLRVKRGRDGKDGKDGSDGKPGRDLTKEQPWQR